MVRRHLSPRFLPLGAFSVSISRHTEWAGAVIGPRDNVFPGPAVALDGPECKWLLLQHVQTRDYYNHTWVAGLVPESSVNAA